MIKSDLVWRSGWWLAACCALLAAAGCSRTHYRLRADRESYSALAAKTVCTPWAPPSDFGIAPHPDSRFFDPTPPDDPQLPAPAPQLYAFRMPDLPERDPRRYRGSGHTGDPASGGAVSAEGIEGSRAFYEAPLTPVSGLQPVTGDVPSIENPSENGGRSSNPRGVWPIRPTAFQPAAESGPQPAPLEQPMAVSELRIVAIPANIWQSLPPGCLIRTFEFDSVREEYRRTFGQEPSAAERDTSQRLALEDMVHLALMNRREYQTQKENLYEAALRLSLRRFEYELKFTPGGNGTDVDYVHNRTGGRTVNNLGISNALSVEKLLATGGSITAGLINSVALTFNGPDGFAADVGSVLAFDATQSIFQRDIVLEGLTQAERDLVYEARRFARSRKLLFQNLSGQYYSLLLNYREIEIAVQDYFSNLRGWLQSEAEYRADRRPRFEVDQFEQRSLESRRRLISTCNSLEQALDRLKIQIGLPPETPLNLDLLELRELTLRDETAATEERVRRTRRNLLTDRQLATPETGVLLNGALDLVRRMQRMIELREQLAGDQQPRAQLQLELEELSVEEAQLDVQFNRRVLEIDASSVPPPPPLRIFQRSLELADSLLLLIERQQSLVARLAGGQQLVEQIRVTVESLRQRNQQLRTAINDAVADRQLERIGALVQDAAALLEDTQILSADVQRILNVPSRTPEQSTAWTLERVDRLLQLSGQLLDQYSGGLVPVEIDMDDAMLTALTLRLDLMNQRESLADNWREIKLVGDDLRSVLNLRASQDLRTRADVNRPFDFTFEESQTRLALQFDAPLNRKAQRNAFRQSLINYNRALRTLMAVEDDIKLSVRDDLRNLQVDSEQYQIAVASAALAYERVVTTNLQLQLGVENITARDVFEAQQDYTASLNALASAHIRYIQDRIGLFMNLELLEVGDDGFWSELYNESYQPVANHQLLDYGRPVYGELVPGLLYSHQLERMLHVPAGETSVFRPASEETPAAVPPEEVPAMPSGNP